MELIGLLLPPVIDLINRRIKDSDGRFWMSVGVCVIVGAGLQAVSGSGNVQDYLESIMIIFGLAQLSYRGVYENSRVQEKIR